MYSTSQPLKHKRQHGEHKEQKSAKEKEKNIKNVFIRVNTVKNSFFIYFILSLRY